MVWYPLIYVLDGDEGCMRPMLVNARNRIVLQNTCNRLNANI